MFVLHEGSAHDGGAPVHREDLAGDLRGAWPQQEGYGIRHSLFVLLGIPGQRAALHPELADMLELGDLARGCRGDGTRRNRIYPDAVPSVPMPTFNPISSIL